MSLVARTVSIQVGSDTHLVTIPGEQGVNRYTQSTAVAKHMVACSNGYSRHCAVFTKVSDMKTQQVSSLEQLNLV